MIYPGAMDTFARGLRAADKILDEGVIAGAVKERYSSYDSGLGAKIEKGETSLEEMEVCVCVSVWQVTIHLVPYLRGGWNHLTLAN